MPRKRNNPPPEVTTMRQALPILAVCVVFDALRGMFEWFVFFGPALAALYCTIKLGGTLGTTASGFICTTAAGIAGVFGAEFTAPFGIVMAMAVGFAGWLAIGLYLVKNNPRIFKENALWFGGSLILSEIPFVGSLPAFTLIVWKMYRTQIRVETAQFKKWEEENAVTLRSEANRQNLERERGLALQQAALDEEWSDRMASQEEENGEIPEEGRGAV